MTHTATAGAALRPRRRGVAACIAVGTLAAHALLLTALTGARPPARPAQAAGAPAVTVRLWLAARALGPGQAPGAQSAERANPGANPDAKPSPNPVARRTPSDAARRKPAAPTLAAAAPDPAQPEPAKPEPAPPIEPAAEPVPIASEPISGAVFAMPTIGIGGGAGGASRWRTAAAAAARKPAALAPQAARPAPAPPPEDSSREHAREHLVRELLQQLATLAPPLDPGPGRCEPDDEVPEPALRCDSAPLQQVFADGGMALASLLASYRALDRRVRTVALAWNEGQYRLDLR